VLEGVMIVKFWLHIDDDEQLHRFQSRERDPLRRWKITDEDWRNRDKAPAYVEAAEEMFERTDHELAPWNLIGANQKRHTRVAVLDTLNQRIEEGMERSGLPVPDEV
jgi:AMP-polyphosphate phosphotransferase